MSHEIPSEAGEVMLEVIENQLEANDPPKTRETLKRLMTEGIARDEALKFIACALSVEIFGAMKHSEPFNPERYDHKLDGLPEMPWEDDE